jgi:hypothetical protein
VKDEAKEQPAGASQIETGLQDAIARLDDAAPGRENLRERKCDQNRDDYGVEFKV